MAKTKSTAVVKQEENNSVSVIHDIPSYLTGKEASGLENLDNNDYNIPQLRLIHPINEEVKQYQGLAIPGEYWHTVMLKSLGQRVPCIVTVARKRTILWRPRNDQGGGILAVSNDSIHWDRGGNTKFTVHIKGRKEPVEWDTKQDVLKSGLTLFGSSNPDDDESQPAATSYYEYINYLPSKEHEGMSPIVMRFHKTGIKAARDLNAYFLMQRQRGVPIYACKIEWFVGTKTGPEGEYFIPRFEPKGYVEKEIFDITSRMHKDYANVELNIEQDKETEVSDKNAPEY